MSGVLLAIATLLAAWMIGGRSGILYVFIYILATMPGWPVGWTLFGRGPAGWIAGALLGYALTALALWTPIAAGVASRNAFLGAWLTIGVVSWLACRRVKGPLVPLTDWSRRDSAALFLLMLIAPAILALPYRNIGARDAEGNRYYRAYFTADFLWHTALTAELTKYQMPPRDPYLGDRPIHYYWTYFLVPAAVAGTGPMAVRNVQLALKVNALCSGLLFIGIIVIAARAAVPRTGPVALAVTLTVLAASSEGAYALYDLYAHGQPLAGVKELNIDALASWFFNGLRIDGLPRSMWYNPQHSMASALGLIVLPVAGLAGVSASLATIVVSGVALGAAVTFNPFIGAVFAAAYAITVAIDAILTRRVAGTIRHLAAAAIVMAAVWWSIANQMVEGAGGALQVGLHRYARSAPLRTLLLSIGPLVVPAAVGLFTPLRVPRRVWPAFAAVVLSLLLFYFVSLNVDRFWVGFRAGQILLITLPVLAARAFAALCRIRTACAVAFAACFAIGLPTTAIDVYNAQDIANREMGPGFHWTIVITPQEQTALDWIRRHTDPRAIVQMEPIVRGRETWTLIPSFAERRMAAGLPISLLNVPEYRSRSESVRSMYDTRDGAAAWRTARELGIDYVYADHVEREAYPEDALAKFDSSPQYFTRIFQTGEVRIWQVRKDQTLAR